VVGNICMPRLDHTIPHHPMGVGTFRMIKVLLVIVRRLMISEISMSKPDHTIPQHPMGVGTFRMIEVLLVIMMV